MMKATAMNPAGLDMFAKHIGMCDLAYEQARRAFDKMLKQLPLQDQCASQSSESFAEAFASVFHLGKQSVYG